MAYSTCSINPIEDEAVVSGLLEKFGGKLRSSFIFQFCFHFYSLSVISRLCIFVLHLI